MNLENKLMHHLIKCFFASYFYIFLNFICRNLVGTECQIQNDALVENSMKRRKKNTKDNAIPPKKPNTRRSTALSRQPPKSTPESEGKDNADEADNTRGFPKVVIKEEQTTHTDEIISTKSSGTLIFQQPTDSQAVKMEFDKLFSRPGLNTTMLGACNQMGVADQSTINTQMMNVLVGNFKMQQLLRSTPISEEKPSTFFMESIKGEAEALGNTEQQPLQVPSIIDSHSVVFESFDLYEETIQQEHLSVARPGSDPPLEILPPSSTVSFQDKPLEPEENMIPHEDLKTELSRMDIFGQDIDGDT